MTALVCFTMDNLADAADLGRGIISKPRRPGERPALEVGYPALLDLFDDHGVNVTHFVEGWNGEAHPDSIREAVKRGHSIGMHGWLHEKWGELDRGSVFSLAKRATEALEAAAGVRPSAFRAPGGKRSLYCKQVLRELGYTIDASLDPDGQESNRVRQLASSLWTVPYLWEGVDASHWLWHDRSAGDVERRWLDLLANASANNGYVVFIWHPHVMGINEERLETGRRILEQVSDRDDLEIVTLDELVSHYQKETI